MLVYNYTTGDFAEQYDLCKAVVAIDDDNLEYGYCSFDDKYLARFSSKHDLFGDRGIVNMIRLTDELRPYVTFSNRGGSWVLTSSYTKAELDNMRYLKGQGGFPYTFRRNYEAIDNFDIFKGKQEHITPVQQYPIADYFNYTFGLEFETSMGYVPQDLCYKLGLIPLRDGSISGLEYSTVVLKGNDGIHYLKEQVDVLNEYTSFNKECSLHMHLGGFPVSEKHIFVLYMICTMLEPELKSYVPQLTFNTARYKQSGKDYCKLLPKVSSFNSLYQTLVGTNYFGNLYQPHPQDINREAKWRCHGRYVWMNLLNMLCYQSPKTVEFRFLRPTYNFHKILIWIYIFNTILKYSEIFADSTDSTDFRYIYLKVRGAGITLKKMFYHVYPANVAEMLLDELQKLSIAVLNQTANNDLIGRDTAIEDAIIDPNIII